MTRRLVPCLALALLLAATSCGRPRAAHTYPGRAVPVGVGLPPGTSAAAGGVSDDPAQALSQVDQWLRGRGYMPLAPAIRNTNMPANGMVAYAVDVQEGRCYTALALARPGADLNMIVLDSQGRTVGYNVDPDPHTWVTACPPTAGRFTVRLQMASGGGEYLYVVYQGAPQTQPNLAELLRPAQPSGGGAPAAGPMGDETKKRLAALDQRLQEDNFQRGSDARGVVLSQGGEQDRSFPLNLQQGTCYAFASLGGDGAEDTDVFITDGSGAILARDDAEERDGLVRFCAENSGSYVVRTRLYQGRGPVWVAAYTQSSSGAPEPEAPVMAPESVASAGLDENFRLLDAELQARGYRAFDDPSRGHLEQGQSRDFGISLEGGKCYAILAVGDNGVRDLDLLLLDSRRRKLDRDIETDARPIVRVCPERSDDFTMQVRMYNGAGDFVYAPYRWPRGTRGPFGLSGLMYVRVAEVTSLLSVEGYEPDPGYTPDKGQLARQGQTKSHKIELGAGTCYSVLVVGGKGVADLDVSLSQGSTRLAADESRNAFPNVRHCPRTAGTYTLAITAKVGHGNYFYQVFKRGSQPASSGAGP